MNATKINPHVIMFKQFGLKLAVEYAAVVLARDSNCNLQLNLANSSKVKLPYEFFG
jgi:hypothetical protein